MNFTLTISLTAEQEAARQLIDERIAERATEENDGMAWARPYVNEAPNAVAQGMVLTRAEHESRINALLIYFATCSKCRACWTALWMLRRNFFMDLKDFVADVISQVVDGVREAIERHDKEGAIGRVSPVFQNKEGNWDWQSAVQNIDFDISVTISDKSSVDGGGGVKVYVLGVSAQGSKAHENTRINNIKFTVPVSLPAHKVSPDPNPP